MSKVFTDKQIAEYKATGHPIADLMELINSHTNSRVYAAANLQMLAEIAMTNYANEQELKSALIKRKQEA